MSEAGLTPAQHRAEAEDLLEGSRSYSPAHPMRLDMLARAQVHAVLALTDLPAEKPKPAPRKRTARKTTAPKETNK